jgi:Domain of unknown function (DUF4234)
VAEVLNIGGQEFKKRNPLGVWGLSIITIGIYYLVWYYKINDEARRYLGDETIKPGISVLAVLFGWIIIVPPFISLYRTGERIQRMQQRAGVQQQISPALFLLANFLLSLHIIYGQEALNKIWTLYQVPAQGPPQPGIAPPGTLPPGGAFTG